MPPGILNELCVHRIHRNSITPAAFFQDAAGVSGYYILAGRAKKGLQECAAFAREAACTD
jgi:hypothetical protein